MISNEFNIKSKIYNRFPYDIVEALIEFNKYISEIDSDYIVFMARKALRLHDLLLLAGGNNCKRAYLSDHVLEQDLLRFRGKKVTLIDDTLILGTTLGRAKRLLESAGTKKVETVVFAIDDDFWCEKLVSPEKHFIKLAHNRILTLCASEVAGLSIAGIPYLSDFPFSQPFRLGINSLSLIQGMHGWEVYNLSTPLQENEGAISFTFLPRFEVLEKLADCIKYLDSDILDITKVRMFGRKTANGFIVKIVPIVTLKPLYLDDVETVFNVILSQVYGNQQNIIDKINSILVTQTCKLRFCQYVISCYLGTLMINEMVKILGFKRSPEFDSNEAALHYGQWLKYEIELIHEFCLKYEDICLNVSLPNTIDVTKAPIPFEIESIVKDDYEKFVGKVNRDDKRHNSSQTLLTDLIQAFNSLYENHEIPARDEVFKHEENIFNIDRKDAPHRDRLNFGFPWSTLSKFLVNDKYYKSNRKNCMLSLLLDYLVDMGIAVPILCNREGVIFRAYRHGEDVKLGDQEIALAYDVVAGFLDGGGVDRIKSVALEKILTLLIKIGSAMDFLSVIHGVSGGEGVARIGYHLHGAVPFIPQHDTYLAENKQSWLSQYLIDREVIVQDETTGFLLGERPEAALKKQNANTNARQIGWLIGRLYNTKVYDDLESKEVRLFSTNDLTLLASCFTPSDAVGALAAEIKIIVNWLDRHINHRIKKLNYDNVNELELLKDKICGGMGYTALNSAKMKLLGFFKNRNSDTIERCLEYFNSLENGEFISMIWKSYWDSLNTTINDAKEESFFIWIEKICRKILILAMGVFTYELAVVSALNKLSNKYNDTLIDTKTKIDKYLSELSDFTKTNREEKRYLQQLREAARFNSVIESPKSFMEKGCTWIIDHQSSCRIVGMQALDVLKDYGRLEPRHNFQYVLWYDIIDSTGQKSNLTGRSLSKYRNQIRNFKQYIYNDLIGVSRDAKRQNAVVHSWLGPIDSLDDEKHIFISGARSLSWLGQVLDIILNRCLVNSVFVRAVIIRADFAGIPAYYYRNDAKVEGESFFEHFSRLKKGLRTIEDDITSSQMKKGSFCWIAGRAIREFNIDDICEFRNPINEKIVTSIENMDLETNTYGGLIS